jgi:hypothetical protein
MADEWHVYEKAFIWGRDRLISGLGFWGFGMTEHRILRSAVGTLVPAALALAPAAQAQDRKVPGSLTELKLSFAAVVKRAAPAVVNV